MTTETNRAELLNEAAELGREAAAAAASWSTDGNESTDSQRAKLQQLRDGDPAVWDILPNTPNLSGEWADDPTPTSLFEELIGRPPELDRLDAESRDAGLLDALAQAWEDGVGETFGPACELQLLRAVGGEVCPRCEGIETSYHGYGNLRQGELWHCDTCSLGFTVIRQADDSPGYCGRCEATGTLSDEKTECPDCHGAGIR